RVKRLQTVGTTLRTLHAKGGPTYPASSREASNEHGLGKPSRSNIRQPNFYHRSLPSRDGRTGKLTGFAGGLPAKINLLSLESGGDLNKATLWTERRISS